jgi:hypothetical protein
MLTFCVQPKEGRVMPKLTSWTSTLCVMAGMALQFLPDAQVRAQEQQQSPQPVQPQTLQQEQQRSQQQDQQQQLLTQKEIQQLVAPIALYSDALVAQVLTASTYPLEIAMAARWSEKNRKVKGEMLQRAMQNQAWDASVKGLTSVPQVLSMMNDKLDWTSRLGEAFLAQPDDVQMAIQALRAQAETAGNLKSTKQQRVRRVAATPSPGYVGPPEYILIEPIEPDYLYVPVYDPTLVFGVGFWEPAYEPFFWYPSWWTVGPVFGFGPVLFVGPALCYNYYWGHAGYSAIHVNHVHYSKFNKAPYSGGDRWTFDPAHRKMAFKNQDLQRQFGKVSNKDLGKTRQGLETGRQFKDVQRGNEITRGQIKEMKGGQTRKSAEGGKAFKGAQGARTSGITNRAQRGGGPIYSAGDRGPKIRAGAGPKLGGGNPKFIGRGGGGGPRISGGGDGPRIGGGGGGPRFAVGGGGPSIGAGGGGPRFTVGGGGGGGPRIGGGGGGGPSIVGGGGGPRMGGGGVGGGGRMGGGGGGGGGGGKR